MKEVWLVRTDDNGIEHVMLKTTDADLARQQLTHYESIGHKQLYELRTEPLRVLGEPRRWICTSLVEEIMVEAGTQRTFQDLRVISARSADEADALLVLHWQKQCSDGHRICRLVERTVELSWH